MPTSPLTVASSPAAMNPPRTVPDDPLQPALEGGDDVGPQDHRDGDVDPVPALDAECGRDGQADGQRGAEPERVAQQRRLRRELAAQDRQPGARAAAVRAARLGVVDGVAALALADRTAGQRGGALGQRARLAQRQLDAAEGHHLLERAVAAHRRPPQVDDGRVEGGQLRLQALDAVAALARVGELLVDAPDLAGERAHGGGDRLAQGGHGAAGQAGDLRPERLAAGQQRLGLGVQGLERAGGGPRARADALDEAQRVLGGGELVARLARAEHGAAPARAAAPPPGRRSGAGRRRCCRRPRPWPAGRAAAGAAATAPGSAAGPTPRPGRPATGDPAHPTRRRPGPRR